MIGWLLVYYVKENQTCNTAKISLSLAYLLCPVIKRGVFFATLICVNLEKCQLSCEEEDKN